MILRDAANSGTSRSIVGGGTGQMARGRMESRNRKEEEERGEGRIEEWRQ